MKKDNKINRRTFIGSSAAAVGATIVPRFVLGGKGFIPPSDKINVGFIGTGTQGIRILMDFLHKPELQVVSVCDVNRDSQDYVAWFKNELRDKIRLFLDEPNWGAGNTGCRAGRVVGKEIVETYYAKNRGVNDYNGCLAYEDFRQLLEENKNIDAVAILTPEHLHATIAIAAMQRGKHTITHKPLSNVQSEVRLAGNIAERSNVATHMFCSSDEHSTPLLCEWIWNGAIGEVREVHNWSSRPFWPQGMTTLPNERPEIPDGFNWDLWLGPVPDRPYHPSYTHAAFRGWYDFGSGALGDMGHYSFYQIFKILKLGAPVKVEASRSQYWEIKDGLWGKQVNTVSYPRASQIHWEFPERENMAPLILHWYDGGLRPPIPEELESDRREMPEEGLLFIGDKGKILADFRGNSPRLIPESRMQSYERPSKTLPRPVDELDQWITAIKGGSPSDARFEKISVINETICLGNIALRMDSKLIWDASSMRFINNEDANKLLKRRYRKGWELG
jgi:predicted dehydrogenase